MWDGDDRFLPEDLGDGLVMRAATADDAPAIADFNAVVHGDPASGTRNEAVGIWTGDLARRKATSGLAQADTLVVVERASGRIVSASVLVSQTWTYRAGVARGSGTSAAVGGSPTGTAAIRAPSSCSVDFPVGQVEAVGTHPAWRRRGLVRRQMERLHQVADARGLLWTVIAGIPGYYRQFGYEMALPLDDGRVGFGALVPHRDPGTPSGVRIRPARPADHTALRSLVFAGTHRSVVSCSRSDAEWAHEFEGRSPGSELDLDWYVIESSRPHHRQGIIGACATVPEGSATRDLTIRLLELDPRAREARWERVLPALLRWFGEGLPGRWPGAALDRVRALVGHDHPAFRSCPDLFPVSIRPYAWYVRVASPDAFIRHVVPVLESRLATSDAARFSGQVVLDRFRDAVALTLDRGRIAEVGMVESRGRLHTTSTFPHETLVSLLTCHRSVADLEGAFPDCRVCTPVRHVIDAMFPKGPSHIWSFG